MLSGYFAARIQIKQSSTEVCSGAKSIEMFESIGYGQKGQEVRFQHSSDYHTSPSLSTEHSNTPQEHRINTHNKRKLKESMLFYTKYVVDKNNQHSQSSYMDNFRKIQAKPLARSVGSLDHKSLQAKSYLQPVFNEGEDKSNNNEFRSRNLTKRDHRPQHVSPKNFTFRTLGTDVPLYNKQKHTKGGILRGHTFPVSNNMDAPTEHSLYERAQPALVTDFMNMQNIDSHGISPNEMLGKRSKKAWSTPRKPVQSDQQSSPLDTHDSTKNETAKTDELTSMPTMQLNGVYVPKHTKTSAVKLKEKKAAPTKKLQFNNPTVRDYKRCEAENTTSIIQNDNVSSTQIEPTDESMISTCTETGNRKKAEINEETLRNAIRTLKEMEKQLDEKKATASNKENDQQTDTAKTDQLTVPKRKKSKRKRLKLPQRKLDIIVEDASEQSDSDASHRETVSQESARTSDDNQSETITDLRNPHVNAHREALENLLQLTSMKPGMRVEILPPISIIKKGKVWRQPVPVKPVSILPISKKEKAMDDIRHKMKQRRQYAVRHA